VINMGSTLIVLAMVLAIWVFVIARARKELFPTALIGEFGLDKDDRMADDVQCHAARVAWRGSGDKVARFSGVSMIGQDQNMLVIKQRNAIQRLFPSIAIPKSRLQYVGTEFVWSAVGRFDVYNIEEIESGQLLLPPNFIEIPLMSSGVRS